MEQDYGPICREIAEKLINTDINFLGIDFDSTLINRHTEGKWQRGADELVPCVRPFFRCLIPICCVRNIQIAIVTFSSQVALIRSVMKTVFGAIADTIPVVGNDETWKCALYPCNESKVGHLWHAAETFHKRGVLVTRKSTLLIDDTIGNIEKAIEVDVRAVTFLPTDISRTIDELLEL